jgi:hypothetical protein
MYLLLALLAVLKRMAVIQMRRKGTPVPKVAPPESLLAAPCISRMRQAPCSPAVVTGSPTALNEFLQLLQQPSTIHTPLYNLTDKLFIANPPVRYTHSSSPHVPQNGMYHPPLTVCLLPLATVFTPTTSKLADRCERQTQAYPLAGKSATRIPKTSLTTSANQRRYHDGNRRQEPTPRSSRLTWLSTTVRLKSDPKRGDRTAMPETMARSERVTCWSSIRIVGVLAAGARYLHIFGAR